MGIVKRLVLVLVFMAFGLWLMVMSCDRRNTIVPITGEMEEIDLDVYRWKNRVVLVFGRSKTDRLYMQQRSELEGTKADLTDRDVAVFELLPAGGSHVGVLPLSQEQHALLRKRFGVGMTEFQIVLVGKDGTVKLRSSQPVTARELFDLIDSMPMRREEMKKEDPSA